MATIDLSPFGLEEKETAVYLALLELGEATLSDIAKKAKVKRTTGYPTIESLHAKGLVGISKRKKRTFYFAQDPRVLETHLEEKKKKLGELLPFLLSLSGSFTKKPNIRYYEGVKGIEQVYNDTLLYPDQEMLAWTTSEALHEFSPDFLYKEYLPKRLNQKIWVRAIAADTKEMRTYQSEDQASLRTTRLVSAKEFPFDVEIDLYGRRNIAVMSFEEEFGMIIESERLWRTLKSIFEISWMASEHGDSRRVS